MKSIELVLPKNVKLFFIFLCIAVFLVILANNLSIFIPFIISAIFAFLLSPIVNYMESYGMKRTIAVLFVFIVVVFTLYMSTRIFLPIIYGEINSLKEELPSYTQSIKRSTNDILLFVKKFESDMGTMKQLGLSKWVEKEINLLTDYKLKNVGVNVAGIIKQVLSSAITFFINLIIVLFLTFFMLKDGIKIKKAIIRMVPNRYFEMVLSVHNEISKQLQKYIKGILLEACIVSVLATIGFYMVGLKYALMVGVLAGILNMISFFGPFITVVIIILVGITTSGSFVLIIKSLFVLFAVQIIDQILYPTIIGKSVNMHPILILFAITIGGSTMGIIGIILAVPILFSVITTVDLLSKGFREYKI